MAMDDLLKEAIADAKAVRETALANAKAALEEAFAPKLQSMLNASLQNEADVDENMHYEDMSDEELTTKPTEEMPMEMDPSMDPPKKEIPMEMEEEFSLESIVKELEEEASAAEANEFSLEEEVPVESVEPIVEDDGIEEDEVDLNELINELKAEYTEATTSSNVDEELAEVKKNLEEHRDVIKFLRSKLNEVNLLNAKLLFTNKLFKNHSMNESQKLKVIETLDRSTNLKECKLVYSTLAETFDGMKSAAKKSPTVRKIVESIASKAIESTKPSEETVKAVINEGADLAARFKKLAGII